MEYAGSAYFANIRDVRRVCENVEIMHHQAIKLHLNLLDEGDSMIGFSYEPEFDA